MLKIQYQDGTSFLHKLHPITKLFWLLLLSIIVFFFQTVWVLIIIFFVLLFTIAIITKNFLKIRGLRLAFITAFFLCLLQLIFNDEGFVMINIFDVLKITNLGIKQGLLISSRFLIIILISYLFVLTTAPSRLAVALMKTGIPYRYVFILITTIRLIPILQEDIRIVNQAQMVRGVNYRVNLFQKLWILPRQFLLPVLIISMKRVDALNFSMEGRCFGKYPTRTYLNESYFTNFDILSLVLLVGVISLSLFY